jgi:TIR domain-containing protein
MIEVHGEEFLGEYKWQFRSEGSRSIEDVVRLSLGTHDFAKISERDAFERIKAALRKAKIDWIYPTMPSEWTFELEGLQKVINTRVDVAWLKGAIAAKPEFNANLHDSAGTHIGTADFVFYFTTEMLAKFTEVSPRNTVFVSYSHFQKKWVERLAVHLKPLQREGRVDLFDDTKIQAGADWRNEIKASLKKAKVAILLISADFLASDFIAENELPPLLEKAEVGGAIIIPVIVSPSRFTKIERLARYQAINDPTVPLEGLDYASSEAVLVRVADAVVDALDRTRRSPAA